MGKHRNRLQLLTCRHVCSAFLGPDTVLWPCSGTVTGLQRPHQCSHPTEYHSRRALYSFFTGLICYGQLFFFVPRASFVRHSWCSPATMWTSMVRSLATEYVPIDNIEGDQIFETHLWWLGQRLLAAGYLVNLVTQTTRRIALPDESYRAGWIHLWWVLNCAEGTGVFSFVHRVQYPFVPFGIDSAWLSLISQP